MGGEEAGKLLLYFKMMLSTTFHAYRTPSVVLVQILQLMGHWRHGLNGSTIKKRLSICANMEASKTGLGEIECSLPFCGPRGPIFSN